MSSVRFLFKSRTVKCCFRPCLFLYAHLNLVPIFAFASLATSTAYDPAMAQRMLCLRGIIPVPYRGNTYNIPLLIWVPPAYPTVPPIAYVVPTSSMVIKPSQHVDVQGRFYHPYLSYWSSQQDSSSIVGLLNVMQSVFTQESPVYSRPAGSNGAVNSNSSSSPGAANGSGNSGGFGNTSQSTSGGVYGSGRPQNTPLYTGPASLPLPQPLSQSTSLPTTLPSLLRQQQQQQQPLDESAIALLSLRSALQDKYKRYAHQQLETTTALVDHLTQEHTQLQSARTILTEGMQKLRQQITECKTTTESLKKQTQEVQALADKYGGQSDVGADDVVVFRGANHRQVFELVAEDHAMEDVVYVLSKQLSGGRMGLQVFLKLVRSVAVEQFMRRALILKIRSGSGSSRPVK